MACSSCGKRNANSTGSRGLSGGGKIQIGGKTYVPKAQPAAPQAGTRTVKPRTRNGN